MNAATRTAPTAPGGTTRPRKPLKALTYVVIFVFALTSAGLTVFTQTMQDNARADGERILQLQQTNAALTADLSKAERTIDDIQTGLRQVCDAWVDPPAESGDWLAEVRKAAGQSKPAPCHTRYTN